MPIQKVFIKLYCFAVCYGLKKTEQVLSPTDKKSGKLSPVLSGLSMLTGRYHEESQIFKDL